MHGSSLVAPRRALALFTTLAAALALMPGPLASGHVLAANCQAVAGVNDRCPAMVGSWPGGAGNLFPIYSGGITSARTGSFAAGTVVIGGDHFAAAVNQVRPDGTRGWEFRYEVAGMNVGASAVASNADGSRVFIAATVWSSSSYALPSSQSLITMALAGGTGRVLWSRTYPADKLHTPDVVGIAISGDGRTVVLGGDWTPKLGPSSFLAVAYDAAAGRLVWAANGLSPAGRDSRVTSVAADSQRAYLSGPTCAAGSSGYSCPGGQTTVALDLRSGRRAWSAFHQPANQGGTQWPSRIRVDPAGHRLFLADTDCAQNTISTGCGGGATETIAYDAATGRSIWSHSYAPADGTIMSDLTLSPAGDRVYVTGGQALTASSSGPAEMMILAYDAASGGSVWTTDPALYMTAPSTTALGIATSPDGSRIFLSGVAGTAVGDGYGWVSSNGQGGSGTGMIAALDLVTVAYDASGNQRWAARYNSGTFGADMSTGAPDFDFPTGLTVMPDGRSLRIAATFAQDKAPPGPGGIPYQLAVVGYPAT